MKFTPPECRLLRPVAIEFFKQPNIAAVLDGYRNIVFYRKDVWDVLLPQQRNRIIFLRAPTISISDATR